MSTVFGTTLIANATGEMGNLAMLLFRIVDTVSTAAGTIGAINGSFTTAQNMSAVQYSSERRLIQLTNSTTARMALHRTSDGDIENHDDECGNSNPTIQPETADLGMVDADRGCLVCFCVLHLQFQAVYAHVIRRADSGDSHCADDPRDTCEG